MQCKAGQYKAGQYESGQYKANMQAYRGTQPGRECWPDSGMRSGFGDIQARLESLRDRGERGVIPFITAGDPNMDASLEIITAMAGAGASVIEVGFPFSDPLADGPVIQAASQRSLAGGFRLEHAWKLARAARERTDVPLIAFTYYNPVFRYGVSRFAAAAAGAGYSGILVPDLPREEAGPLLQSCQEYGLAWIPLVAPTTPEARLAQVIDGGGGFVYCISVTGVTGARARLSDRVAPLVERIRRHTDLPVAVGFGISGAAQAREAAKMADAVIIGSALIQKIAEAKSPVEAATMAGELVTELKSAVTGVL